MYKSFNAVLLVDPLLEVEQKLKKGQIPVFPAYPA
jgi:hypothetical protein